MRFAQNIKHLYAYTNRFSEKYEMFNLKYAVELYIRLIRKGETIKK